MSRMVTSVNLKGLAEIIRPAGRTAGHRIDAPRPSAKFVLDRSTSSAFQPGMRTISITRLKNFAMEKLPQQSAFREVLLSEKDEISSADFLARLPVWLALLRQGQERRD